jgi:hypothetical protein
MYELKENITSPVAADEGNTGDMSVDVDVEAAALVSRTGDEAGCAIAAPAMRWKQSFNLAHHRAED